MEQTYIKLNLPNFITIAIMAMLGGLIISWILSIISKVGKTGDAMGGAEQYGPE